MTGFFQRTGANAMRAWTAGILAAVIVAATAAAGDATNNGEDFWAAMDEGKALLRIGGHDNISGAAGRFRAARILRRDHPEVHFWLGLANSDSGNLGEAVLNAKNAIRIDDQMASAWLLLGQAQLYLGLFGEARESLEKALELAPENPLVLFNLGRAFYHANPPRLERANPLFRAVWRDYSGLRQTQPELFRVVLQARLYIAYIHEEFEEWDDAIRIYKDVRENFVEFLPDGAENFDLPARLAAALRLSTERPDGPGEARDLYEHLLRRLENPDERLLRRLQDPGEQKRLEALLADIHFRLGHLYLTEPRGRNQFLAVQQFKAFLNMNYDRHPRDRHDQYEMVKDFVGKYDTQGGR